MQKKVPSVWPPILCLILNIIGPGIGSFLGGHYLRGIIQFIAFLGSLAIIAFSLYGLFLLAIVWFWALGSGIELVISRTQHPH